MTTATETRERLFKREAGEYVTQDGRFLVYKNDRGYGYTVEDRERWVARYGHSTQAIGRMLPHCENIEWTVGSLADAREFVARKRDEAEGWGAGYGNMLDAIAATGDEAGRYKMSDDHAMNLAHLAERLAAGDTSTDTIKRARIEAYIVKQAANRK